MGNNEYIINPLKGGTIQGVDESHIQRRHKDISAICDAIAGTTQMFNAQDACVMVQNYAEEYGRWFYSDITNYLFAIDENDQTTFFSNLEEMLKFSHTGYSSGDEKENKEELQRMIDKLWDHSNLAQRQKEIIGKKESDIKRHMELVVTPQMMEFREKTSKELISLIAIFTALSFIVFGGISSLDNIFDGVVSVPIIQLVIVGCIWGLCMLNLVFVFMFLISKLTGLPMKSDDSPEASLSRKYPFLTWSNFFLLLILTISSWLYYIDYSNTGSWIIEWSRSHSVCSTVIGGLVIAVIFGFTAGALLKKGGSNANRK